MVCKGIVICKILNKPELICLDTVKWFQVFKSNSDNSNQRLSFVFTQLNS